MRNNFFKLIFLIILSTPWLFSCASTRMNINLQRGRLHFEAGAYRQAFNELLPLASEGNPEAEYAVGYMYYNGFGVAEDQDTGIFWIKKAAAQHYEPAKRALKVR